MAGTQQWGSSVTQWGFVAPGQVQLRTNPEVGDRICRHAVEQEEGVWTVARGVEVEDAQQGLVVVVCWDCLKAAVRETEPAWETGAED